MPEVEWIVRPKGADDVDAAVELLAAVAREGRWIATEWPFDLRLRARMLREALHARRVVGWVAIEARALVGDLTIFELAEREPMFGMAVAATHRRRGIGRGLIEAALDWGHANAKTGLRLRVFPDNGAALALYRATGFIDVELERNAIPRADGTALDVLLMRRPIADAS